MGDVQQQLADGAQPRAKVGDVFKHGEAIPANVVMLRDAEGDTRSGYIVQLYVRDGDGEEDWWPMTVVEVDPEPQPAWTGFVHAFLPGSDDCCNALLATGSPRLTGKVRCGNVQEAPCHLQPAVPGPLVLTLPEVPEGAVALVGIKADGEPGERYTRTKGYDWASVWMLRSGDGPNAALLTFAEVLCREQRVTVEFAPPREPRVWEPPDEVPEDLPGLVEVNGSRYRHAGDLTYVHEQTGGMWDWWSLRGSGLVREVLS